MSLRLQRSPPAPRPRRRNPDPAKETHIMTRSLLARFSAAALVAVGATLSPLLASEAHAMKIQEITTKGGIKAWLVEEHAVPLVALRYAFDGGNAQDPDGKEGLAHFLTGMMDEGAADLDAQAFQRRMEEIAMRMTFQDDKDHLYGSFETLTENRKVAVELLKKVINQPRFDAAPLERVRTQLAAGLAFAARDPNKLASQQWYQTAFAGHPYGRPSNGTAESLKAITSADLEAYRRAVFAKDTLRVVLVGDITATDAASMLDDIFGGIADKATLRAVPATPLKVKAKVSIIDMPVPQSVAIFGSTGLPRKDKDFMAGFVLNHILGGGGFSSRLMEQVREKRGLAYGVGSSLQPYRRASVFVGSVATKNEQMAQSIDVIKAELKSLADTGPSQVELDNAKNYLVGSFPLRFDTNSKIANQLLYFLQEDFGLDYVDHRNAEVAAVTLDDVKRVAKRLFGADDLFISIVGQPKGIQPKG
jgi:zinc protease